MAVDPRGAVDAGRARERFNGGLQIGGTATTAQGSMTVRGSIESGETIRVLSETRLTVRSEIESGTVFVGRNATLVANGELSADRLVARSGSDVRLEGPLVCDESGVVPSASVRVRGGIDCGGIDQREPEKQRVYGDRVENETPANGELPGTGTEPDTKRPMTGNRTETATESHSNVTETGQNDARNRTGRDSIQTPPTGSANGTDQPASLDTTSSIQTVSAKDGLERTASQSSTSK